MTCDWLQPCAMQWPPATELNAKPNLSVLPQPEPLGQEPVVRPPRIHQLEVTSGLLWPVMAYLPPLCGSAHVP